MRLILMAALTLSLCGLSRSAAAQLYSPALPGALSAYEFHSGTYTTVRGRTYPAMLKLMMTSDDQGNRRSLRYATMVKRGDDGQIVRPDSVAGFSFDGRNFIHLGQLTTDKRLRDAIETDFVEVLLDTAGTIELYGYYPRRGNRYALSPITPGMIHEDDLTRAFIWRRRGAPSFDVMAPVPPRGYNREFENQLRALFADRADIVQLIDAHSIRRSDLPAVVRAYNSGLPLRFE